MSIPLLRIIEEHPAMRHGVFQTLARCKPLPQTLAAFLWQMGAFCEASRAGGTLAATLRQQGLQQQALLVDGIITSEQDHGQDFAQMAKLLLSGSSLADMEWGTFPEELQLAETRACIECFRRREDPTHTFYSLGVMLVVELAANRMIIPGEVAAWIGTGFYGLSLSNVPYLDEHAGDDGAEHDHEGQILAVIGALSEGVMESVEQGTREFLDRLEAFYNRLDVILEG